jgi:glycosyltransferase involved in cell wall biosynthesis
MDDAEHLLRATPAGIRVLVCTGYFHPHIGGSERYSEMLWREMRRYGWSPTVLTANTESAAGAEDFRGIAVLRLPARDVAQRLPLPTPTIQGVRMLRSVVRWRPQLVVTNTRFFPTTAIGAAISRRSAVSHVHIEHGSSHVPFASGVASAVAKAVDLTVGRWSVQHAEDLFGVSAAAADFISRLTGRRAAGVIPNGVVPRNSFEPVRSDFNLPEGPLVLHVGRLIPEKGTRTLIAAWRLLRDERVTLVVAGEGALLQELREARAEGLRIIPLGRVEPERIQPLLRCADLFIHPSEAAEGMPTAILEAGAAGLPVVATPVGENAAILGEGRGFLVSPGNPSELAHVVQVLLRNETARSTAGSALREYVERNHSWSAIAHEADMLLRPYVELRQHV